MRSIKNKKHQSVMTVHTRLPFGKYKDEYTVYELINLDVKYIDWLIKDVWQGIIDPDVELLVYNKLNNVSDINDNVFLK